MAKYKYVCDNCSLNAEYVYWNYKYQEPKLLGYKCHTHRVDEYLRSILIEMTIDYYIKLQKLEILK